MIPSIHANVEELLTTVVGEKTTTVLIKEFGTGREVLDATDSDLRKIKGVGLKTVGKLLALRGIAREMIICEDSKPVYYIHGPEDVATLLQQEMGILDREHFRIILLSTKSRIIAVRTIAIGTLNGAMVHAREVFKAAILESAQAVVLVHNHPSGTAQPSHEDIEVTKRLAKAGKILGITLLDHVILTSEEFISLQKEGYISETKST